MTSTAVWLLLRSEDGLTAKNTTFKTEIVATDASREQGLSGRAGIDNDQTMVFLYNSPRQLCFWMKDMQFAIDMVWVDQSGHVAAIESDVSPGTYPESFCHEGQYVAEFAAGTAARLGLSIGDTVKL